MEFRILDAAVEAERAEWLKIWQEWPAREPGGHPAYAALFAGDGEKACCAVGYDANGTVLFPIILRPLSVQSWAANEKAFDVTTPYGYGGPFRSGAPNTAAFTGAFENWALENGVVCSFARLSLFPEQLIEWPGAQFTQLNVVRELQSGSEAIWNNYEYKVRKNVNKARRSGLTTISDDGERLEEFLEIYYSTMERRQAGQGYYFSRKFFETIVREMPGSFRFFHTLNGEQIVSTELVLVSTDYLYSFLGGTRADSFDLRPNDLLKHAIIEWGAEQNKKGFVLGGGYGGEDGIYRYKLSFAPDGATPFFVARNIHDAASYEKLVEQRRTFESEAGREWEPRAEFFPAYRS